MYRLSIGQVFICLVIAIGLGSLVVAVYALNDYGHEVDIARRGEYTDATLILLTPRDGCTADATITYTACERQIRICDVTYRYTAPRPPAPQHVFTQRALVRLSFCTHQVGDTVEVDYLPANPAESRLASEGVNVGVLLVRAFTAAGVCGVCLLLLLISGVVMIFQRPNPATNSRSSQNEV
jgi:uncharacterized protein DUF3592